MKILLLLNRDIYALHAFNLLREELQKHEIKIFFSKQVGAKKDLDPRLTELQKIEQKNLPEISASEICENINSVDSIAKIKNFSPDLIISIRFGQILQQPVINIPKLGIINLHSGILPNYRGVMPTFFAMLNGEKEIGTTLHYINDHKIDQGQIIKISKQKTDYKKSYMENVLSLYNQGCAAIIDFLNGRIKSDPPEIMQGKYFSYPNKTDLENFAKIAPLFRDHIA